MPTLSATARAKYKSAQEVGLTDDMDVDYDYDEIIGEYTEGSSQQLLYRTPILTRRI